MGMSTTDEPAAGCAIVRDEDEGTSTRHSPSVSLITAAHVLLLFSHFNGGNAF